MNGAQITYAVLIIISLMINSYEHGKPKTGKNSIWPALIGLIIVQPILWWGGFWEIAK